MSDNIMSIEDFLTIAGVKLETVKKHKDEIPGLTICEGEFLILEGTRYPCFYRDKIKNTADRRYLLLRAISEYKYIDHLKLRVTHSQFKDLLKDLLDAGLIRENHLANHYGANAYDCTIKGDELLHFTKQKAIKEISNTVAACGGHFVGAVISEASGIQ